MTWKETGQNAQEQASLHVSSALMTTLACAQTMQIVILSGSHIIKEVIIMNTMNALKVRINMLQNRDPVGNMRIINKLKRKLRAMEQTNA